MKCIECNKNFTAKRSDAKYCSHNCQVKNYNRRKQQQFDFKIQQEKALGKVKEQQQIKQLEINKKIKLIKEQLIPLQHSLMELKEEKQILLIELTTIQKQKNEAQEEISKLMKALAMDDEEFCKEYCQSEEIRTDKYNRVLNGLINLTLSAYNKEEQRKKMNTLRDEMTEQLMELEDSLQEDKSFIKEHYLHLKSIHQKIEKIQKKIKELNQKIKALEHQKSVSVKPIEIKKQNQPTQTTLVQRNNNTQKSNHAVGGAELLNMTFNTFQLNGELGRFLGELDRNMTAFALTGDSGAGKSYFSFELAKAFIDHNFKAKYFALEEGLGKLTQNKVRYYNLDNNLTITGNGTLREVRNDAKNYDLIVIDSFQKLNVKAEEFERLRQDFPKTIFIIIFQKTTAGTMRGGSSIKFNSSATIDVQLKDDERIAVMEKGRYGTIGWVYSIDEGIVINEI